MQVRLVAEPADLHIVAAAVVAITSMKRLMDVAHDVQDVLESERLLLARCIRIAHGMREPRQRAHSTYGDLAALPASELVAADCASGAEAAMLEMRQLGGPSRAEFVG